MKFIKEMMTRKHRPADAEEDAVVENEILASDDFDDDEPSDEELYSGLAAIQSLLDDEPEPLDEDELAELAEMEASDADQEDKVQSAPAVVNFADLVSEIQSPEPETTPPVEPVAKAPEDTRKLAVAPKPNETATAKVAEPTKPNVENGDENARTADELAAALGPGVTVTVKDRPVSKHTAFKQKRFANASEPDTAEIAQPDDALNSEEPMEPSSVKSKQDDVTISPPRLVTPKPEKASSSDIASAEDQTPPQANIIKVPAPAAGRSGRRAGRVKTRLLGFNQGDEANDPFETSSTKIETAKASYPTGWIVIVEGPGRGTSFTLYNGVSQIGRGDDQPIKLGFGDTSISRSNHAAIAYDDQEHKFFLGHGGKANLVRLNDRPVLSTEEIASNDLIRIGETTLRFVGFCGAHFDWGDDAPEEMDDAAIA